MQKSAENSGSFQARYDIVGWLDVYTVFTNQTEARNKSCFFYSSRVSYALTFSWYTHL